MTTRTTGCASVRTNGRVADHFDHEASQGPRSILDPHGPTVRLHRHLGVGRGEVPADDGFGTPAEAGFDGTMTACGFASEARRGKRALHARRDAATRAQALEPARSRRRFTEVIAGGRLVPDADADRRGAEIAAGPCAATVCDTNGAPVGGQGINAVMICSGGPAHEAAILPARAVGRPVSCERERATTQEACLGIIDREAKPRRRLVRIGLLRRHDASRSASRAKPQAGRIGASPICRAAHRDASGAADLHGSGSAILDTMVPVMEVARSPLDDEVRADRIVASQRFPAGLPLRDPHLAVIERIGGARATVEFNLGHGTVAGLGAALHGERETFETWRGHAGQEIAHAPIARDKQLRRSGAAAATGALAHRPGLWS